MHFAACRKPQKRLHIPTGPLERERESAFLNVLVCGFPLLTVSLGPSSAIHSTPVFQPTAQFALTSMSLSCSTNTPPPPPYPSLKADSSLQADSTFKYQFVLVIHLLPNIVKSLHDFGYGKAIIPFASTPPCLNRSTYHQHSTQGATPMSFLLKNSWHAL